MHPGLPAYMHAKLLQSCQTLHDPMDGIAHQAPLSMGFSRQEYWGGLPCSPPGDLPDPGLNSHLLYPALAGVFFTTSVAQSTYIYTLQFSLSVVSNSL